MPMHCPITDREERRGITRCIDVTDRCNKLNGSRDRVFLKLICTNNLTFIRISRSKNLDQHDTSYMNLPMELFTTPRDARYTSGRHGVDLAACAQLYGLSEEALRNIAHEFNLAKPALEPAL